MYLKNEKQLVFVIRYTLPVFILIISILITTFLYYENKHEFEVFKKETEQNFIKHNKELIQQQVNNIYKYIIAEQKDTEDKLKASLNTRVNEAHETIVNIYNQFNEQYTKEQLTKIIKASISKIRFNNNRGYFFVYDKEATNIIHPLVPKLEGKNLINHKDTKGTYVLKESLSLLENKEQSYQEWYWRKSKDDMKEYKKIGFVKNIYELDWFIGTGEYVDDFEVDIQKKVLAQIEKLKFGKNSYFIVTDKDNNYISHINRDLIGQNALKKLEDMNDHLSLNKIKETIAKKEGYVYLKFYKPNSKKLSFKIIYLKTIPKWGWVISTGFYKDDIDILINQEKEKLTKKYKENLNYLLIITLIITSLLVLLSFYISKIIKDKFKKYKTNIEHHINENQKQYELLAQKSKMAAMGEMIENIAHQWRQPLSVITTASTGIKLHKDMQTLEDSFLEESIDNITTSANHLSETIEDFRDFFKPDKEKTVFGLKDAIEKTFKLLSSQIKNKNIKVIKDIDDINIENFERELLQVLLNIINNAKDAIEDKKDPMIFIKAKKVKDNIIIKIKDNGEGIKEDIIDRIFEPYFTTKHKSQGTGIGLYMSQEMITRHMKGSIEVKNRTYTYKNKKYKGAEFIIKLPINKI